MTNGVSCAACFADMDMCGLRAHIEAVHGGPSRAADKIRARIAELERKQGWPYSLTETGEISGLKFALAAVEGK